VLWLIPAVAAWWERVLIWHLMIAAGVALAATVAVLVLTLLVAASLGIVNWVRRRQHATGACNACDHPCKAVAASPPAEAPARLAALPIPRRVPR
jgi:hypothetical protein